jgi:hypothetical protein
MALALATPALSGVWPSSLLGDGGGYSATTTILYHINTGGHLFFELPYV